jgi:hypothetical protein
VLFRKKYQESWELVTQSVILATQEAEFRKIEVSLPWANSSLDPILGGKNNLSPPPLTHTHTHKEKSKKTIKRASVQLRSKKSYITNYFIYILKVLVKLSQFLKY